VKALSVRQPFATLLTISAKRVETRSWRPAGLHPGDWVAIHAARQWWRGGIELAETEPFAAALGQAHRAGLAVPTDPRDLPRGCVLAVARYTRCIPSEGGDVAALPEQERAFGVYGPGRWGWVFGAVRPLRQPIPARGALGLWEWDAPADLEHLLLEVM
jgi:hypothetical protein